VCGKPGASGYHATLLRWERGGFFICYDDMLKSKREEGATRQGLAVPNISIFAQRRGNRGGDQTRHFKPTPKDEGNQPARNNLNEESPQPKVTQVHPQIPRNTHRDSEKRYSFVETEHGEETPNGQKKTSSWTSVANSERYSTNSQREQKVKNETVGETWEAIKL